MDVFGSYLGVKSWYQFLIIDGEIVEAFFLNPMFPSYEEFVSALLSLGSELPQRARGLLGSARQGLSRSTAQDLVSEGVCFLLWPGCQAYLTLSPN